MSSSATLLRSKSAPQPIAAFIPTASTSDGVHMQRSVSQQDVEKTSFAKRQAAKQQNATKSRQGLYLRSLSLPKDDDPFNLSKFFPTSLSAIEREEEEWQWLREEGEGKMQEGYERHRGDEEGPVRGGRSAIFGLETSEAIKGEDKLGVLSLKDVSLFSASAADYDHRYGGRLMSPYASDEAVDEHSLYLAQCARRERAVASSAVAGGAPYGQLFLAK